MANGHFCDACGKQNPEHSRFCGECGQPLSNTGSTSGDHSYDVSHTQGGRNALFEDLELECVGFWPRVGASLIDAILTGIVVWPLLTAFYGESYWRSEKFIWGPMDFLLGWVFPAVAVITFWVVKQATPGKMAISARIADATTGGAPSVGQCIGRYFAYFLATIPLGLGLIWVAFDDRKQGWHDKLAGTVVVRPKPGGKGA